MAPANTYCAFARLVMSCAPALWIPAAFATAPGCPHSSLYHNMSHTSPPRPTCPPPPLSTCCRRCSGASRSTRWARWGWARRWTAWARRCPQPTSSETSSSFSSRSTAAAREGRGAPAGMGAGSIGPEAGWAGQRARREMRRHCCGWSKAVGGVYALGSGGLGARGAACGDRSRGRSLQGAQAVPTKLLRGAVLGWPNVRCSVMLAKPQWGGWHTWSAVGAAEAGGVLGAGVGPAGGCASLAWLCAGASGLAHGAYVRTARRTGARGPLVGCVKWGGGGAWDSAVHLQPDGRETGPALWVALVMRAAETRQVGRRGRMVHVGGHASRVCRPG